MYLALVSHYNYQSADLHLQNLIKTEFLEMIETVLSDNLILFTHLQFECNV